VKAKNLLKCKDLVRSRLLIIIEGDIINVRGGRASHLSSHLKQIMKYYEVTIAKKWKC